MNAIAVEIPKETVVLLLYLC